MDPLSVAASVIAVIQISQSIISICRSYITHVSDTPNDLWTILVEVGSVKSILEVLHLLAANEGGEGRYKILLELEGPMGPLQGCKKDLEALAKLIPPPSIDAGDGKAKRKKIAQCLKALAWPLHREKARSLLGNIGRYKATMSLALTTEAAQDLKHIRSAFGMRERTEILKWLVTTDPSPNHNKACDLHEKDTCNWLFRSEEYSRWKGGDVRFLWLHGIPGAGKTVLLSHAVEDMKLHCKSSCSDERPNNSQFAWCYYYCYYGRAQEETPHMIRWLLNQLCRQMKDIPVEVSELYEEGSQPTTSQLYVTLRKVLLNFKRVYLMIDALDESLRRQHILEFLRVVIDGESPDYPEFGRLQVLATSRKEHDIERALSGVATDISLSNSYVDEDIRAFIQHRLRDDRKFNRWPQELRSEIEDALVGGAKGMFRWVVCQLDVLKRLNFARDIHKALRELPETLDETYERILNSIPTYNQAWVHRTLQLLSFDFGITSLSALTDALTVDVEKFSFHRNDGPLDPEAVLDICGCLITILPDDEEGFSVQLAHYTVKEYLMSERICVAVPRFQMSHNSIHIFATKCFITYMTEEDYDHLPSASKLADDASENEGDFEVTRGHQPLITIATKSWATSFRHIEDDTAKQALTPLVLKLFDVTKKHFKRWVKIAAALSCLEMEWTADAGAESCVTLAYLCSVECLEAAKIILERRPVLFESQLTSILRQNSWERMLDQSSLCEVHRIKDGTVLHIAARLGRLSFLEHFISKGVDTNVRCANRLSILGAAIDARSSRSAKSCLKVVSLLLANNVDPNLRGVSITPLQIAILRPKHICESDIEIIKTLLAAGANVNGVADDQANLDRLHHLFRNVTAQAKYHWVPPQSPSEQGAIRRRQTQAVYDTPLRIALRRRAEIIKAQSIKTSQEEQRLLNALIELLKSHGAKSFNAFDVKAPEVNIKKNQLEHNSDAYLPSGMEHQESQQTDVAENMNVDITPKVRISDFDFPLRLSGRSNEQTARYWHDYSH